jgi:putative CocE/NonD family hydrolase
MARENPPHLTAMFVGGGTTNYHFDTEGTGGAFRQVHNLLYSLILASTLPKVRRNRPVLAWLEECEKNAGEWMKKALSKQIAIFEGVPEAYKWYSDWVDHADFDEYWQQGGYCSEGFYDQYPDIPVYRSTGHYGQESRSSIVTYIELAKINKAPTFLQYAPWAAYEAGEVEFGPEYPSDDRRDRMRDEHLKFFDQFFMDIDTGILDEPKVKVFMMGGGEGNKSINGRMIHGGTWRLEESWPLPGTKFTEFYLHPDGTLKPEIPEFADSSTSYSYDPKDPVPTLGGTYAYPRERSGPWDQRSRLGYYMCQDDLPFSAREDVLTFQTLPLDENIEIIGSLTMKLWASSSAVDTDFTAKLIDVYPPSEDYPHGFALGLMDSIIRARYRESFEKPVLMEKGKIYEFTIDLWQVSNLFQAGHRIRLDISSSNFPAFDVNPNTGEKIGYHTGTVVARNTIYHDAAHPSHVVLPVVSKGK